MKKKHLLPKQSKVVVWWWWKSTFLKQKELTQHKLLSGEVDIIKQSAKRALGVMGKHLFLIEMLALPGLIYCLGVHQSLLLSYQISRSTLLFSVKSYRFSLNIKQKSPCFGKATMVILRQVEKSKSEVFKKSLKRLVYFTASDTEQH